MARLNAAGRWAGHALCLVASLSLNAYFLAFWRPDYEKPGNAGGDFAGWQEEEWRPGRRPAMPRMRRPDPVDTLADRSRWRMLEAAGTTTTEAAQGTTTTAVAAPGTTTTAAADTTTADPADTTADTAISTTMAEDVSSSSSSLHNICCNDLGAGSSSNSISGCLGGVGSSAGSASGYSSCQDGHAHQHDAMLFLFNALMVGAAVMHFLTLFPYLQETVVLFVLGMVYSLVMEGLEWKNDIGVFGCSYSMWMDIDPHLLLFTMLPALLAGDAMSIDTSVAKRVGKQCLYLAGPGVLINATLAAVFLRYFLDWPFLLCMVTGSILCATDPVAVVALLKELGASPVLTVQIQGESLLNDGTAIVVYMLSYNMLTGEQYDVIDVIMFLARVALLAWALGMFIGYFFFSWIRLASNKLEHHSSMIQIALTLCCAYWSFIIAEGVFHLSGVLATVASSLVLAHHMWPHIVSPESMHHVWHTFEALGNILLFFLAGSLTGNVMVHIEPINYLYLVVIYIVLLVIRGSLIFASRPLLKYLSADRQEVTLAEAAVMTWGGLRGAVGLALAIQVHHERAERIDEPGVFAIDETQGQQVLFFVSGIALLTTVVNATTAPMLVKWLEITALPAAQQKLLTMLHKQLMEWSIHSNHPPAVTKSLLKMLEDIQEAIKAQKVRKDGTNRQRKTIPMKPSPGMTTKDLGIHYVQDNQTVVEQFEEAQKEFVEVKDKSTNLKLMGHLPEPNLLGQTDTMIQLIKSTPLDETMAQTVNKAFLGLVNSNYWKTIQLGNLKPGSLEADVLLTSVRLALSPLRADLLDFHFLRKHVRAHMKKESQDDAGWWKVCPEDDQIGGVEDERRETPSRAPALATFIRSAGFQIFISVTIVLNGVFVAVDEIARNEDNQYHLSWISIEGLFTAVFILECVLKFIVFRLDFFYENWNRFDFCLVVLAAFGFAVSCEVQVNQPEDDGSQGQAKALRLSRAFRLLRFLRVIRLFHANLGREKVSEEIGNRMHRIVSLVTFVHAHLHSQVEIVKYFGGNNQIDESDESEIARCIVQSQTQVYRALTMAAQEEMSMDNTIVEELRWIKERKKITETLEEFVMDAYRDGAISARDTEAILHPMHHELHHCLEAINHATEGFLEDDHHHHHGPLSLAGAIEKKKEAEAKLLSSSLNFASQMFHTASGARGGSQVAFNASSGQGQGTAAASSSPPASPTDGASTSSTSPPPRPPILGASTLPPPLPQPALPAAPVHSQEQAPPNIAPPSPGPEASAGGTATATSSAPPRPKRLAPLGRPADGANGGEGRGASPPQPDTTLGSGFTGAPPPQPNTIASAAKDASPPQSHTTVAVEAKDAPPPQPDTALAAEAKEAGASSEMDRSATLLPPDTAATSDAAGTGGAMAEGASPPLPPPPFPPDMNASSEAKGAEGAAVISDDENEPV